MATNRLLLFFRGERSRSFGETDGGEPRSPRLPFVVVVFFTIVSSSGITYVLSTLMDPSPRVPFVSSPVFPLPDIGVVEQRSKGDEGDDSFYRTIINNNIFRPLGWTPPRPVESYRLIGTILPRDANTPPTAIIETTAGKTTSIVSVGDALDPETEVVSIESKSVVLDSGGVHRTLRLSPIF
ncbi:MAG: hypothetical protein OXI63_20220 [Candidatus Poribacteria bacterium]|nr:hypothetical protein [Candidatus Poribacteria bacterium]